MTDFNTMGKIELRAACKDAGVKGYGKMTNDQMRQALVTATEAHDVAEVVQPDASLSEAEQKAEQKAEDAFAACAPSGLQNFVQQMTGEQPEVAKKITEAATPKKRAASGRKIEKAREEQNGVKKPSVGGVCREVWDFCDHVQATEGVAAVTASVVRQAAEDKGWNPNNASIELYQWRKFNGISGRTAKAK